MMSASSCTHIEMRSRERGAALLTSLMIATLVLAAGGALILTTSNSTTTAIDATAEMQAYYGAEAGLQQVLNVLRGNVNPHDITAGTKITFRNAVKRNFTNVPSDPNSAPLRFSGWLVYNYTSTGSAYPDRVKVFPTDNTYSPLTGIAFSVSVTDPDSTPETGGDPPRLVVQSIGYGPKGSMKRMEMVVHRNYFNFEPPAAITLIGGTNMTFEMGTSNASGYTGNDTSIPPITGIPTIAVSAINLGAAQAEIDQMNLQGGGSDQVTPSTAVALTADNTPDILKTAKDARDFLATAKEIADGNHRLFPSQDAVTGGLGTLTERLTTVIDNYGGEPVELGPGFQGAGMLIVTGELITGGTTDFEGVIMVLGEGIFNRNGNGNGHIDGGIIVASFDPDPAATTGFFNPTFSVNGGGNSDVRYDSDAIRRAFDSAGVFVAGIHEY